MSHSTYKAYEEHGRWWHAIHYATCDYLRNKSNNLPNSFVKAGQVHMLIHFVGDPQGVHIAEVKISRNRSDSMTRYANTGDVKMVKVI